jgi:hypothetical protein
VQLIKECHALDDILLGQIAKAIAKCSLALGLPARCRLRAAREPPAGGAFA